MFTALRRLCGRVEVAFWDSSDKCIDGVDRAFSPLEAVYSKCPERAE